MNFQKNYLSTSRQMTRLVLENLKLNDPKSKQNETLNKHHDM